MRKRFARILVASVLMPMGVGGVVPLSAAQAESGGLSFNGCIGDHAGCISTNPAHALDLAVAVVVTPDGRHLYAAARPGIGGDAISHFTIDSAGNLRFAGCIGGEPGCAPTTHFALAGTSANEMTVTPDGRNLYFAGDQQLSHLRIDAAGNLTFAGCIGQLPGCTPTQPPDALDGAQAAVVTPDGGHLYVAAINGRDISHWTIDSAGNLTPAGCIGDNPGNGNAACTPTNPAGALDYVDALALIPNGKHLYAEANGAVSHLTIDSAGSPTFAGCVGSSPGCTPTSPNDAFFGSGLAVTPDGKQLYASAGDGVSHLTIDSGGNPTLAGCIGDRSGCTPTYPAHALRATREPRAMTIRPDGRHLYITALPRDYGGVVTDLYIDAGGSLRVVGCTGDGAGCTPIKTAGALYSPTGLAVTPNGGHLYAAAGGGNDVSHFTIHPVLVVFSKVRQTNKCFRPGGLSAPRHTRSQTRRRCRKRGTTFSFVLDQSATVKIAIQIKRPGRRAHHRCKPSSRKLRHKPRCKRTITITTLTRKAHAGLNKIKFSGRIHGKPLKPGRYQAVFTAIGAEGTSAPSRLRFTIVKP